MNEERGTRGERRAEAGPDTSDGHQAGPALERGGNASGRAGAGGWSGADGPDGAGAHGGPGPAGQQSGKRSKTRSWWVELPILLAFALILALLIKTFVVQAFFIPSSSMENTLEIGDKVLVNKMIYDFRPIHRGDVVVFNGEGSWDPVPSQSTPPLERLWNAISGLFGTAPGVHDYIKRVIGVPGDHVACCDAQGRITVNGVPLNEKSYLYPGNPPSTSRFSITVPPGRLWVMGDHRSVSFDSRGHEQDPGNGTVPEDRVVGRAFVIVAPVSRWKVLPIPATFQQPQLARAAALAPTGSVPAGRAALTGLRAPAVPLGLGLTGAFPLTLFQLRLRRRLAGLAAAQASGAGPSRARSPGARRSRARPGRGDGMLVPPVRHPGYTPRRAAGLTGYERVLARAGFVQVAGIDEAGRGACAGPLVVAAVMLDPRRRSGIGDIADSKSLTAVAREEAYRQVMALAVSWHVVVIPSEEIDRTGLHVCNIAGMRRALAGLSPQPEYVLTDGFPVRGLGVPALAMWKGDEVAACVAAASVVAKVTRDRLMRDLHTRYPVYGFARHKGYSTRSHMRALTAYGPCPEHRRSFANVGGVARDPTDLEAPDPTDLEVSYPTELEVPGPTELEVPDPAELGAGDPTCLEN